MKLLVYAFSIALLVVLTRGQDIQDDYVQVHVTNDKAIITWKPDRNYTHYTVEVGYMSKDVAGYKVLFDNLTANTNYDVKIYVSDPLDGPQYLYQTYSFKTLLAPASNLTIIHATKDTIHLSWNAVEDSIDYSVLVKDSNHQLINAAVSVKGNKGTISGLEPAHFYYIYIEVISNGARSAPAIIGARTDGTGVKVSLWNHGQGNVQGGEVVVYRPLRIPIGPYTIKVNFHCPLKEVKVWNAEYDEKNSDLTTGMVVAHQKLQWQKQNSMIMMNFYPSMEGPYCEITNTSVSALFGNAAVNAADIEAEDTINTDVGALAFEWMENSMINVSSAGLIQVMLKDTYNSSHARDAENRKPDEGTYIIVLDAGEDCPGGITINSIWGMTQKSSAGMPGAIPQVKYFVQTGNDWYSNEPGLIYGYDPKNCPDRSHVSAQIMSGGVFVQSVVYAPDESLAK